MPKPSGASWLIAQGLHFAASDDIMSSSGAGSSLPPSAPSQRRRSSGRKSHEMNVSKGTMDQAKQVQNNNNSTHNSNNKNNSGVGKASNRAHLQSSSINNSTTLGNDNNNKRQLEMQNNKPQGGSISTMKMKGVHNQREVKVEQQQNNRHARAVAAASAAAAEAAAVAAQAAAEVMRLTQSGIASSYSGNRPLSLDDLPLHHFFRASHAATLIQSAYRGHLARQALRALKGLVKLQAVVRGYLVRRQARISLHCMQALVRLQARVRARQVKAALMLEQADEHVPKHSGDPSFGRTHYQKVHETATRHRHSSAPAPDISARAPIGLMLRPTESMHTPFLPQHAHHNKAMDTFSRASSLISSEDSRDWDSSALSKEEIELKVLKKQHAQAMRQKALSYAETHQRTPARSSVTPTRRVSNEYYQPQQQRFSRLSFNETEPENLHRDWSWLEGWMAAHGGATSLWESNAAALWESRDERRDRGGDKEEQYGYFYVEDEVEENEEEEENARISSNSLFHDYFNSDDDPAIKIIEMDRVATPPSYLAYPLNFISPARSPTPNPFSTRNNQHSTSYVRNGHHHPLHSSRLHYGSVSHHHGVPPLSPPG